MDDCFDSAVTDRFDELRSDMENGFSKLGKNVGRMSADELRRDIDNLMMIGHSQMDTIRRQSREIDEMRSDLLSLHKERGRTIQATLNLLETMGIAYDVEDDCPSKWIRMAASVARGRRCEAETETVTDLDRREGTTETALVAIMGVFVLCVVVWAVLMVSVWVR